MEVDHTDKGKRQGQGNGKSKGKGKGKAKVKAKAKTTGKKKATAKAKGKGEGNGKSEDKGAKSDLCGKKGHFVRDCWSQAKLRQNSGRCKSGLRCSKRVCAFTTENIVKDVGLSHCGCEVHEDGLVMIDSGASIIVCPKWFGEYVPEKPDGSVQCRGADG